MAEESGIRNPDSDSQPPVEEQPVELTTKGERLAGNWPNPRPAVIASTLEWAARMWLMDGDPARAFEFTALAEEAFERATHGTDSAHTG